MNGEQFNFGQEFGELKGKVESLNIKMDTCIETVDKFTKGVGERVEKHTEKLATIESQMDIVKTVSKWIFAPVFGAVAVAILYMVLKK